MRKTVTVAVLVVIAGTLVLPTVASPLLSSDSERIGNNVAVSPSEKGNGGYAHLNENDELVIDLSASNPNVEGDGVNADGVTTISNVFNITYNGSEYAHVWIEYDHDAITFTANGESIHNESNNVTLAPGAESVPIGIRIDTTQDVSDTGIITEDDFTIHAKVAEPPEASGSSSAGASSSVATTSTVVSSPAANERTVSITNLQPGTSERIDLDGMTVSDAVTLDSLDVERASFGDVDLSLAGSPGAPEPGTELRAATGDEPLGYVAVESEQSDGIAAATFTFTVDREALAARGAEPADLRVYRYDGTSYAPLGVEVVETTADSVRITVESSGFSVFAVGIRGPSFTVTNASVSRAAVETGESTTVTATVENTGGADGETTVRLLANGEPVESETVTVESGTSETVTFDVAFDDPGEYDLVVGNASAGTLSVTAAGGSESTETATAVETAEADSTTATATESTAAAAATTDTETTPVREPSGFGFAELLGVVSLLAIVLLTLALVRRVPRR